MTAGLIAENRAAGKASLAWQRQLVDVAGRLPAGGKFDIDFTENDEHLTLRSQPGIVAISSTYSADTAQVDVEDLQRATETFREQALRDFEGRCLGLTDNPMLADLVSPR